MNNINYNLKKHVELLKLKVKVLSQKIFFFKENRTEALELSNYSAAVSQHIFWEDRFEVASVIQAFMNKEMYGREFHDSVFGLRRKHLVKVDKFLSKLVSEEIKDFSPTKESSKFSGFLSALYFECEHFDDYVENGLETAEFYTSIKNGFLNLQKVLDKD